MGIFKRRTPQPETPTPTPAPAPAPSGPGRAEQPFPLSDQETQRVAGLVHQDLLARGQNVTWADGGARTSDGDYYPIDNLVDRLAGVPEDHWAQAVHAHFNALFADKDKEVDLHSSDVLIQLRDAEWESPRELDYQPLEIAPGIRAVIAVDTPETVLTPTSLSLRNSTPEQAYSLARTNLLNRPMPAPEPIRLGPDENTSDMLLFLGDDWFVAARLFVLPQFLAQQGIAMPEGGVFVGVPHRHALMVYLPMDARTLSALPVMAQIAGNQFMENAPGISPHLFHVLPNGSISQFSSIEDGKLVLNGSGPAAAALAPYLSDPGAADNGH
ncbi:hypothetical protein ACMYYO_05790 [Dermacoccaceae bacterium W4C1]